MKIKTRFNLTIIVTVIILLVGASFAMVGIVKVRGILNETLLLNDLMEQLFTLKTLTLEYVNHPSRRVVGQWVTQYQKIDIHIVPTPVTSDVQEAYENIPVVFQEIMKTTVSDPPDERARVTANNYRKQLFSLLLIEMQRIVDWSQRISNNAQARLLLAVQLYSLCTVVLLILISMITGLILYKSKVRLVTSISTLEQGAQALARGDLTHRIDLATHDEFGELADSFNAMADKLKAHVELESRLSQSQKIEALGTMAGGIAHDFNNILAGIIGYTDLISMKNNDAALNGYLQNLQKAAQRATDLVKQILAFSRTQEREVRPVQITPIVKETMKFLRSTIPATIDIRTDIPSEAIVVADPTDIHRIVVNLCTNAGFAMNKQGGMLEVGLEDVELDALFAESHQIQPGRYVRLRVADTGCGMTPDVQARIFEPFFTTRQDRGGTGMGLSVVYGIVQSRAGAITVESEPDRGTTICIYLPAATTEAIRGEAPPSPSLPGDARILFVDDEAAIADSLGSGLAGLGYKVRTFTSSTEALAVFQRDPAAFDVVITDMTMPVMTGDMLTDNLRRIRPDMPVILCTGFNENITAEGARKLGINEFVMKPVSANQLSLIIHKVLIHRL